MKLPKAALWGGGAAFALFFLWLGWTLGGKLGAPEPFETDVVMLKSRNIFERASAAHSLGESGDKWALQPLIEALDDPVDAVRLNAAAALGKLGSPAAIDPLKRCLDSESSDLRQRAAMALAELGEDVVVSTSSRSR